jgi:hypothetical protein
MKRILCSVLFAAATAALFGTGMMRNRTTPRW